jgi:hypothetical protein
MAVQRHNPRITKWPRFIAAAKRRGYKYSTAAQRRRVANAWKKYKNKGAFGVPMDKVLKPKKKARRRPAAASTRKRKLSAWQRFLKKVAGKGYSMADKKRMYKRMKSSAKPLAPKRKTTKRKPTRRRRGAGRKMQARKPGSVGSQLSAAEKRARRKAAARKAARTRAKNKRQSKIRNLRKQGYTYGAIQGMERAGSPLWARANGLALKNGNVVGNYFRNWSDYAVASATGLGVGAAAHGALFASGWAPSVLDSAESLPVVGTVLSYPIPGFDRSITSLAPHTLFGGAALAGLGALAAVCRMVPACPPAVEAFLSNAGVAAAATGVLFDIYNLSAEYVAPIVPGSDDAPLSGLALDNVSALGGLALDNVSALGGLALDNVSALGGLALDNFGDGFAYQTAPLQASNVGDYTQCSMGDAFYSGADFSSAEGQCIMNGRETFFGQFGAPSYRPKSDPHSASHYAGQPGHRWGWLIQTCGWPKAQQIAALPPRKRLKVIAEMRKAAMAAFQRETLLSRASAVEAATPAPESLLPAAGSVAGGASAPGGPVGAYGDPALFMA